MTTFRVTNLRGNFFGETYHVAVAMICAKLFGHEVAFEPVTQRRFGAEGATKPAQISFLTKIRVILQLGKLRQKDPVQLEIQSIVRGISDRTIRSKMLASTETKSRDDDDDNDDDDNDDESLIKSNARELLGISSGQSSQISLPQTTEEIIAPAFWLIEKNRELLENVNLSDLIFRVFEDTYRWRYRETNHRDRRRPNQPTATKPTGSNSLVVPELALFEQLISGEKPEVADASAASTSQASTKPEGAQSSSSSSGGASASAATRRYTDRSAKLPKAGNKVLIRIRNKKGETAHRNLKPEDLVTILGVLPKLNIQYAILIGDKYDRAFETKLQSDIKRTIGSRLHIVDFRNVYYVQLSEDRGRLTTSDKQFYTPNRDNNFVAQLMFFRALSRGGFNLVLQLGMLSGALDGAAYIGVPTAFFSANYNTKLHVGGDPQRRMRLAALALPNLHVIGYHRTKQMADLNQRNFELPPEPGEGPPITNRAAVLKFYEIVEELMRQEVSTASSTTPGDGTQ